MMTAAKLIMLQEQQPATQGTPPATARVARAARIRRRARRMAGGCQTGGLTRGAGPLHGRLEVDGLAHPDLVVEQHDLARLRQLLAPAPAMNSSVSGTLKLACFDPASVEWLRAGHCQSWAAEISWRSLLHDYFNTLTLQQHQRTSCSHVAVLPDDKAERRALGLQASHDAPVARLRVGAQGLALLRARIVQRHVEAHVAGGQLHHVLHPLLAGRLDELVPAPEAYVRHVPC